jgi:hypothetical protein
MQASRALGPGQGQPQMGEAETRARHAADAVSMARERSLDDRHACGCDQTVFTVLKSAYGLPDAAHPSVASALNGGTYGALTRAALAVGLVAERRMADHGAAKRAHAKPWPRPWTRSARRTASLTGRDLIGCDLRALGGHQAFHESGA